MMTSHHNCLGNRRECVARYVADFYMRHPEQAGDDKTAKEIIVHLVQDSMSPTEWYQFTDDDYGRCYTGFEEKVDAVVENDVWTVIEEDCHTKDGRIVELSVNESYIERVENYVRLNLDIPATTLKTTTTTVPGGNPIARPNILQVIIEIVVNFFRNLFGWV